MLKQATIYKGIPLEAFYKVTWVSITEIWSDEVGKLYSAEVTVNSYTSETKEFDLNQVSYKFDNIREEQFTLPSCYAGLKQLPEFSEAIDC